MENIWNTSVDDLFRIFRGSLISLIPWIEKARIPWKEDSYDDWYNIASVLYQNIVCSSLYGEIMHDFPIAKYGFHIENYKSIDFVNVLCENSSFPNLAFVSFVSKQSPFDFVLVSAIDSNFMFVEDIILPINEIKFEFCKWEKNKLLSIQEINVLL